MKLLYITNGITGAGGLERVLSVKASMLAEDLGYEVHIVSLNEEGVAPFYDFSPKVIRHTIRAKGNPFSYLTAYKTGILQKVKEIKPHMILVCDDGLKGFFIPRLLEKKIPCIYERHVSKNINTSALQANFLKNLSQNFQVKAMDYLSNDFDAFVVLTEGNISEWPRTRKVKVIPNPLSFYPSESAALTQRKVIAVGKQSYQKSYDRLLKIWQKATLEYVDWELHIYGKEDKKENLPALAVELGIEKTVFFHDAVKNIEENYLDSSIFVLSSRYEGFGMVIIEAMSCGLPVISFDCPHGPADIISDGRDGFLVENGNIEEFAQRLEELMQDENLRHKMGSAGRINVKRYHPETVLKNWHHLFQSFAAKV